MDYKKLRLDGTRSTLTFLDPGTSIDLGAIERAAYRLTAPGLGKEVGASLGVSQSLYQGLFLAPTVVAGALKGAVFAANLYEKLGFGVVPNGSESRHDIIQAITFGTPEGVIRFCEGIQAAAPVDSFVISASNLLMFACLLSIVLLLLFYCIWSFAVFFGTSFTVWV